MEVAYTFTADEAASTKIMHRLGEMKLVKAERTEDGALVTVADDCLTPEYTGKYGDRLDQVGNVIREWAPDVTRAE